MRNRVRLLLAVMMALPFISMGTVVGAHEDTDQATTSSEPVAATTEDKVLDDTTAADYKAKLQERLAERKTQLKTKLTNAQQARIKARCKASQTLISKVSQKTKETKTSRQEVHDNILKRLNGLSTKLKDSGKDTTELDKNITELQALITTFNNDMTTLRQAASDISNMDCASDPSSFKASLEELRTSRETVAKDSAAIRTYITGTLKTTLSTLKTQVGGNSTGGTQ